MCRLFGGAGDGLGVDPRPASGRIGTRGATAKSPVARAGVRQSQRGGPRAPPPLGRTRGKSAPLPSAACQAWPLGFGGAPACQSVKTLSES